MRMFNRKVIGETTPSTNTHHPSPYKGFSLIESLVATAIVGIGFVGIYSLVMLSEQFTKWAIARQKLQMYANQMLEVIDGDVTNTDSYNLTLQTCTNPAPATTTSLVRAYEWCYRMSNELGAAGATDVRTITVTNMGGNKRSVVIRLEAYSAKAQVIMEKIYVIS